jgi:hypothetical protein
MPVPQREDGSPLFINGIVRLRWTEFRLDATKSLPCRRQAYLLDRARIQRPELLRAAPADARDGVLSDIIGTRAGFVELMGAFVSGELIRGVLVGVSPFDPLTLVSVAIGLALVALAACYVPARRVLRIDPAQSLRQ